MKLLIERLKSEKLAIEAENKKHYESKLGGRRQAYNAGKAIARTWIKNSTYQEIMDVLQHQATKRGYNNAMQKRHIYFTSIEKVCPKEALKFKWVCNDAFMDGWLEGVFIIWKAIRRDVDNELIDMKEKINP